MNPDSDEYLGHYASQQKTYIDALSRGGITVSRSILYLSLQGRIVELDFRTS